MGGGLRRGARWARGGGCDVASPFPFTAGGSAPVAQSPRRLRAALSARGSLGAPLTRGTRTRPPRMQCCFTFYWGGRHAEVLQGWVAPDQLGLLEEFDDRNRLGTLSTPFK